MTGAPPLPLLFAGALGAALASWALTGAVRRYALARSLVDVPNHRSSHTVPTPRGGGLAIALVTLVGLLAAGAGGLVPRPAVAALAGGGAAVALVGWIDDHRSVPAWLRLITHLAAAAWAVYWLGGLPRIVFGVGAVHVGALGSALAVVGIVWCTNLYNFMDGIDGIAGGEGVCVALATALLMLGAGNVGLAAVALLIAASCGGFLVWNWAPARIFMGDVGSGLLGFLLGTLAVAGENSGAVPLLVSYLLAGVFVLDATATLVRRLAAGGRWSEAHRSHAYQRAVQAGWGHARVSASVLAINAPLAGLAWAGWSQPALLPGAVLLGTVAIAALYWWVERARPM